MNKKSKQRLKKLLSTRVGGAAYKIFYDGLYYRMKPGGEVLHSKSSFLEQLGVNYNELSAEERAYVTQRLSVLWYNFYKNALDRGQYWGTLLVQLPDGETVHLHGYSTDPAKMEAMQAYKHNQSVAVYRKEKKAEDVYNTWKKHEPEKQEKLPMGNAYSFENYS